MNVLRRCLGLLMLGASAAQAACPLPADGPGNFSAGPVQANWVTEPTKLEVGEPFVMLVNLCPANAKLAGVHATMPEHRHGMNYAPTFQSLGKGLWRVEGMLWHMAGRWELKLDTELAGAPFALTQSVNLQ